MLALFHIFRELQVATDMLGGNRIVSCSMSLLFERSDASRGMQARGMVRKADLHLFSFRCELA